MDYKIDLDQLAQGVPVFSSETLKGDIWPEDIEEFLADLRQSRKSGYYKQGEWLWVKR